MVYENESQNAERFSLHDCRARSAEFDNGTLTFFFPDGFYYAPYGNDWPNTGDAAVSFKTKGAYLYLFVEKDGQTIRENYPADQLVDMINRKEWEPEFLYRYDGYKEIMFYGWIWVTGEPFFHEFQLFIATDEETYRWNPIK
ncbi:MAG: hypothetical protein IKI42_02260 [Clostridia bacterium]|nr:hypothetical protein [Clostridia bacterium]